jgi:hypothetical protein
VAGWSRRSPTLASPLVTSLFSLGLKTASISLILNQRYRLYAVVAAVGMWATRPRCPLCPHSKRAAAACQAGHLPAIAERLVKALLVVEGVPAGVILSIFSVGIAANPSYS